MERFLTVGHGALGADAFTELVRGAEVEVVADVRSFPGSRRHPHFGRAMEQWLAEAGVAYAWVPALGGRRPTAAGSANAGLRNPQFRAYADHMATGEFARGVAELSALAAVHRVAYMCAEAVWWRCHRRLLSDHLVLVAGAVVDHLFHDGRLARHPPTPEARRVDDHLVYDIGTQQELPDARP